MKIYAVEGNRQALDGGAMFGNAPKELWKRWITPDDRNRIPLACRCLLLQTDEGLNYLFETGAGAFYDEKLRERFGITSSKNELIENLLKLGIKESDINGIILSHLHFDHAGGLLSAYEEGPLRLLFPKARYYVSIDQWNTALSPHIREQASFIPHLQRLLKDSGRLVFIDGETYPDLDFGVRFHFSHGHTKGLMVSEIALADGPLVYISDLCPGRPWVHLPITMGYDRCSEVIVDEKRRLFEKLLPMNAKLFFAHDPEVACGLLRRDESGRFFTEECSLS